MAESSRGQHFGCSGGTGAEIGVFGMLSSILLGIQLTISISSTSNDNNNNNNNDNNNNNNNNLNDNSMVMTMVTNTNMNMVLPAVGRNIKDHLSRNDQAISKILYLLCSLRSEESYHNIFLERLKQFMVLDLLEEVPVAIIDTLINLSKKNAWCKQILKRSDLFTTQ